MCPVSVIVGNRTVFYFFFESIFFDRLISAIIMVIAVATVVGASAPFISFGVLVPVLTIVGVDLFCDMTI